jgi:outer membrane protein OmpA-like peptidoglycan-associated protein
MTMHRNLLLAELLLALTAWPAAAQPKDIAGSRDSPLASRYPGSVIDNYKTKEFDEFSFPVGAVTSQGAPKSLHLEGKITRIEYINPQGRSPLEIYRNYETALKRAGFETLFACSGDACGMARFHMTSDWSDTWYGAGHYQFSGKLARPEGDLYVSLHVAPDTTNLDTIEIKPIEGGLVTVNAAALKGDIGTTGHAAVYGIYFDTAKADIKPESAPALQEIGKLLQQDPNLKLYIVGHTDSVGDLQMNMDLSRRRADAVVKALTGAYGVAPERLQAYGAGPMAPVASNRDERGRAKNRRVELVER